MDVFFLLGYGVVLTVMEDGQMSYWFDMGIDVNCEMNFANYPLDDQWCFVVFGSITADEKAQVNAFVKCTFLPVEETPGL